MSSTDLTVQALQKTACCYSPRFHLCRHFVLLAVITGRYRCLLDLMLEEMVTLESIPEVGTNKNILCEPMTLSQTLVGKAYKPSGNFSIIPETRTVWVEIQIT